MYQVIKKFIKVCTAAICALMLTASHQAVNAMNVVYVADNTAEMQERGMMGRFFVPDIDISVGVFDTSKADGNTKQAVVDYEDSASWFMYGTEQIIADHNEQGFIRLTGAVVDKTRAYMQKGAEIQKYVCVETGIGGNRTNALVDANGVQFNNRTDGNIITYTCYDGWEVVFYAVWAPIEENI